MKNEKKKDVLIGVLIAIVFILLAVLIALSISEKTKKNDPNDDVKNSTSTTTTAETSENETEAAAIEKELNDYIKNNPTPLEIKYGLTRKIEVQLPEEIIINYYYNSDVIIKAEVYTSYTEDEFLTNIKKDLQNDLIYIKELKDTTTNNAYFLVGEEANDLFTPDHYLYDKDFNKIFTFKMPFVEARDENKHNILTDGKAIELSNNRVEYFLENDNCNNNKAELHEVYVENGKLKDNIKKIYELDKLEIVSPNC